MHELRVTAWADDERRSEYIRCWCSRCSLTRTPPMILVRLLALYGYLVLCRYMLPSATRTAVSAALYVYVYAAAPHPAARIPWKLRACSRARGGAAASRWQLGVCSGDQNTCTRRKTIAVHFQSTRTIVQDRQSMRDVSATFAVTVTSPSPSPLL
eukprot:COSAG02_NODE_2171_length_9598_cov_30.756817_5_plen_155_part_00